MFEFFIQHQLSCLLLVVAVLFIGACAAHYKIHPGALNATDSAAYDTLLIAEAAIDQARAENQTHPLSAGAKDALNILVDSYNVARSAWLTYRGAIATNTPTEQYFQHLTRNLTDLTDALNALKRREVKP